MCLGQNFNLKKKRVLEKLFDYILELIHKLNNPAQRWKVEQVFGMQHWQRGLKLCWQRAKKSFLALCQLSASIHNFKLIGIYG